QADQAADVRPGEIRPAPTPGTGRINHLPQEMRLMGLEGGPTNCGRTIFQTELTPLEARQESAAAVAELPPRPAAEPPRQSRTIAGGVARSVGGSAAGRGGSSATAAADSCRASSGQPLTIGIGTPPWRTTMMLVFDPAVGRAGCTDGRSLGASLTERSLAPVRCRLHCATSPSAGCSPADSAINEWSQRRASDRARVGSRGWIGSSSIGSSAGDMKDSSSGRGNGARPCAGSYR
ncbi:hypothetical protein, partial [Nitrosomonas communis]|uniref:hypothetical protein n=1 Tax=Nitrosomonas communis TaxID=44574 RepID=UPI003D28375E